MSEEGFGKLPGLGLWAKQTTTTPPTCNNSTAATQKTFPACLNLFFFPPLFQTQPRHAHPFPSPTFIPLWAERAPTLTITMEDDQLRRVLSNPGQASFTPEEDVALLDGVHQSQPRKYLEWNDPNAYVPPPWPAPPAVVTIPEDVDMPPPPATPKTAGGPARPDQRGKDGHEEESWVVRSPAGADGNLKGEV